MASTQSERWISCSRRRSVRDQQHAVHRVRRSPDESSIDVELRGDIFTDAKSTEKFTASFSVEDMHLILAMLLKIDTNAAMERTRWDDPSRVPDAAAARSWYADKTLAFDAAAYGVVFDCDYCKKLRLDVELTMRSEAGSRSCPRYQQPIQLAWHVCGRKRRHWHCHRHVREDVSVDVQRAASRR